MEAGDFNESWDREPSDATDIPQEDFGIVFDSKQCDFFFSHQLMGKIQ